MLIGAQTTASDKLLMDSYVSTGNLEQKRMWLEAAAKIGG